jgi:hypothetical protein
MFVIDENVSELEVLRLRKARIRVRLIGDEIARTGDTDENLLPVLRGLKQPIFFTQDQDFIRFSWLHPDYGLVWLETHPNAVADYVRRFLRHPEFETQAKRLGIVARVRASGVSYWRVGSRQLRHAAWPAG